MTGVALRKGLPVTKTEFKQNTWRLKGHYNDICHAIIDISNTNRKCLLRKFVDGVFQTTTLLSINHRNIVAIYGETVMDIGTSLLITEYCDQFLSDFMDTGKMKQYERSKEIALIFRWSIHASNAVEYLHNLDITHGIITPRAFVITPGFDLKLFEMPFQTMRVGSRQAVLKSDDFYAIWNPDLMEQGASDDLFIMFMEDGKYIDIDMLGLLIWQLVCSDTPLNKDILTMRGGGGSADPLYYHPNRLYHRPFKPKIPICCPRSLSSVIRLCWKRGAGWGKIISITDIVQSLTKAYAEECLQVATPAEIIELGAEALAAYKEAAASGTQVVKRTRLMLVGQERVGKTSLKNRLAKNSFKDNENITDGIDTSTTCLLGGEGSRWAYSTIAGDGEDIFKKACETVAAKTIKLRSDHKGESEILESKQSDEAPDVNEQLDDPECKEEQSPQETHDKLEGDRQLKKRSNRVSFRQNTIDIPSDEQYDPLVEDIDEQETNTDTKNVQPDDTVDVDQPRKASLTGGISRISDEKSQNQQSVENNLSEVLETSTDTWEDYDDGQEPPSAKEPQAGNETTETSKRRTMKKQPAVEDISPDTSDEENDSLTYSNVVTTDDVSDEISTISTKDLLHAVDHETSQELNTSKTTQQPTTNDEDDQVVDETAPDSDTMNTEEPKKGVELLYALMDKVAVADDASKIDLTIWDFAGQDLYYTTHQVFLSRRAVYLVVFDLSQNLKHQATVNIPRGVAKIMGVLKNIFKSKNTKTRDHEFTTMEFLDFWMQSIYTFVTANKVTDGKQEQLSPPIFIVGTHKHSVSKSIQERERLIQDTFDAISRMIRERPYRKHVITRFYAVDSSVDDDKDPEVIRLREHIERVARSEPYMREEIPVRWLLFEQAVQETVESGVHYLSFKEARMLPGANEIENDEEYNTLLLFYSDLGKIIYIKDGGSSLSQLVILDPVWLIDVFKKVITVLDSEERRAMDIDAWIKLDEKGILEDGLVTFLWRDMLGDESECQSTKAALLELMEKFDLLCYKLSSSEDEPRQYYVPARMQPINKQKKDKDEKAVFFVQHSTVFYIDFGFLPDGVFHRVLVRSAHWSQLQGGLEPKLYYRYAVFFADDYHEFEIEMAPAREAKIKVTVIPAILAGSGDADSTTKQGMADATSKVKTFLAHTLQDIKTTWAKRIEYRFTITCPCDANDALHYLDLEECLNRDVIPCSKHRRVQTQGIQQMFSKHKPSHDSDGVESRVKSPSDETKPEKVTGADEQLHIMISYQWDAQTRMIKLKEELSDAGYKVWMDIEKMEGNMDDRMAEAVEGAGVVLLCFSDKYQRSKNCKKEAQYADKCGKHIIPLKYEDFEPSSWLGLLLSKLIYYDVRSEDSMMENLPNIIKELRNRGVHCQPKVE